MHSNSQDHRNRKCVQKLCTGCGTCSAVCPTKSISMRLDSKGFYYPEINSKSCIDCRLCDNTCPGTSVDIEGLNKFVFGRKPTDYFVGNFKNCYVGHSLDPDLRCRGTSGGLVTTILTYALEAGIIDGALVTRMNARDPLKPEVILASTKKEILLASKSKYCPVPVNAAIREILRRNGKFAVVGLPCHIQGIRKMEMVNKQLRAKLKLHIGLFCFECVGFCGTEFLFQKLKVKKQDIESLDYRGKGWPGGMVIRLKDKTDRFIPYADYWGGIFGYHFFTTFRCTLCSDATNEFADISFGDAWFPELSGGKVGQSLIISRNAETETLLKKLEQQKKLKLSNINNEKLMVSHRDLLRFKKEHLLARIQIVNSLFNNEFTLNGRLATPTPVSYINGLLVYSCIFLGSKPFFQKLLKFVPFGVLRGARTRFL